MDSRIGAQDGDFTKSKSRRYIPHLAEFYFSPEHDWSLDEARALYKTKPKRIGSLQIDKVYYRDCVDGMSKIPDGSVDLVVADPPFGIQFDGKSSVYNRDETLVVEDYQEIHGSYEGFTRQWMEEVSRLIKQDGSAYIFSGWTNLEDVLRAARETGLHTLNHIVWHYNFGVFTKRRFVTSHYHILLLVKNPDNYFFNKIEHYPKDVWLVNRQYRVGEAKNGTKLPTDLVARCIDYSTKPGDLVLDPFMGNGTTAVASKANYRHFIGFEVNKKLKEIIDSELEKIRIGSDYCPYKDRLPSILELAALYPRAYREYLQQNESSEERSSDSL